MDNLKEDPDLKRHDQAHLDTVCPGCGVYPGQLHHPVCIPRAGPSSEQVGYGGIQLAGQK